MSLRERKKARTRKAILDAAHDLLQVKPYEETTMEDIAERADVGVGTTYNYFRSKGEMLLALISESDDRYLEEAQAMIAGPHGPAIDELTDLMVLASEYCVGQLSKSVWKHVSAAALTNADSAFGRQYTITTKNHENLVVELMKSLARDKQIRSDMDIELAAHFLFSMKSKLFLDFVSDDAVTLDTHRNEVRKGVQYFLAGIYAEQKQAELNSS